MSRSIRPGPVSPAEMEQRSRKIIEVATEEFLANGFRGTTLAQIAKRSRVSKATLYAEFSSKEELFHRITTATIPDFRDNQLGALDPDRPFAEVIRTVVALFIESVADRGANDLLQLAISERNAFPILAEMAFKNAVDLVRPLGAYLQAKAEPGALDEREALWAAFQLMNMSNGGFASVLTGDEIDFRSAQWMDLVARIFTAGFPLDEAQSP